MFAAKVLSRNFPDGFTAYDAEGQWFDDYSNRTVREQTKVVIVAVAANVDIASAVKAVMDTYRRQFHQLSVGVISETSCAAF
jgi:hypothetical protein